MINEEKWLENKVAETLALIAQKPLFDETCLFSQVARFLGDKWIIIVIFALSEKSKRHNELKNQIPTITPRMLARTLKKLEAGGLVARKVYPESPPRVEYSLTPFGKSLLPTFALLFDWARNNEAKIKNWFD